MFDVVVVVLCPRVWLLFFMFICCPVLTCLGLRYVVVVFDWVFAGFGFLFLFFVVASVFRLCLCCCCVRDLFLFVCLSL